MAPGKLVAEAGGTPKKIGLEVETMVLVQLLLLLAGPFTSKPYKRFEAESVDVHAVVTEAVVDGLVARPVKTGALVGRVVVSFTGVDKGREVGGPMQPRTGFKLKVVEPVVAERVELKEAPGVAEGIQDMGLSLALSDGVRKRGWDMGQAEDRPGVTGEGGLGGRLLCTSNNMLFGVQSSEPPNPSTPATPGMSSPGFRVGAEYREPWAFVEVSV
jgi:hypothetical protein